MSLELERKAVTKYLSKLFRPPISVSTFRKLGVGVQIGRAHV